MIDRQEKGQRLYLASKQGDTKQARELLMSGALVDFVSVDDNDQTPLIVASQNGHREIASILLDFGAAKDARSRVRSLSLFCGLVVCLDDIVCLWLRGLIRLID